MTLKHVDFEVASWGELASGPAGSGGGAALTQDVAASFPDRGDVGMLLTMSSGAGEHYIEHDLGAEQDPLYVRLMLGLGTASGGAVTFGRCLDDGAVETLSASLDADTGALTVDLAGGDQLLGTLHPNMPWHCVEILVSATTATLWINGVAIMTKTGSYGALASQTVRIGCITKDTATIGALYLDEWIMSTTYIGPVVIEPSSAFPSDPTRWLVLYNRDDDDSVTWAEHYRSVRSVPYANLVSLSVSTYELITDVDATTIKAAVSDYLTDNRLDANVVGILIGYGFPGVAAGPPVRSLASMLAVLDDNTEAANTRYQSGVVGTDDLPDRSSLLIVPPYYVAEMNAPSLADAMDLDDRADALTVTDAVWRELTVLDPATDKLAAAASSWDDLAAYLADVESQQVRLPLASGYTGTPHGHAVELTDDTAGAVSVTGQTKALIVSASEAAEQAR